MHPHGGGGPSCRQFAGAARNGAHHVHQRPQEGTMLRHHFPYLFAAAVAIGAACTSGAQPLTSAAKDISHASPAPTTTRAPSTSSTSTTALETTTTTTTTSP